MEFKYLVLFLGTVGFLVAYATARAADPEYDDTEYDDAAAPAAAAAPAPKPAVPVRHGALLNRRNPLANGRSIGGKTATVTSTTQAPQPKEEDIIDENEEEVPVEVPTTDPPKRLKPGVRPFRSNDDLLAALKRRREQAASQKSNPKPASAETDEASAPVAEANTKSKVANGANGGRRRYSAPSKTNTSANEAAPVEEQTAAPVRAGRRFSPRS